MIRYPTKQEILDVINENQMNEPHRYGKMVARYQKYGKLIKDCKTDEEAYKLYSKNFRGNPRLNPNAKSFTEQSASKEYIKFFGHLFYQDYVPTMFNVDRSDEEFIVNKIMRGRPLNRLNPGDKSVLTPIPTVDNNTPKLSLKEVCDLRSKEFKELSETHIIYLLWSGGIDSTLAYYSLVNNNVPIQVIFNEDSVKEYPKLAEEIRSVGIDVFEPTIKEYQELLDNPNNVIISGGSGDEIFAGVGECEWRDIDEVLNWEQPYKEHIPQQLQDTVRPYIQQLIGDKDDTLTVGEWRWALHFLFKYQQIQISGMYTLGLDLTGRKNGHIGKFFYDTPEFNIWSIQNYDKLCGEEWKNKRIAKLVIFKYNNDNDYLNDKRKFCSMRKTMYREDVLEIITPKKPIIDYSGTVKGTGITTLGEAERRIIF